MHPRVPRKLIDAVAKLLSIILEKLWQSCEVISGWKKGNITPSFKMVKKRMLAVTNLFWTSQYRTRPVRVGPEEGNKKDQRGGKPLLCGKTVVQSAKENALYRTHCGLSV